MTGFICVNKEEGVSSAAEVGRIRRLTGTPCGHMGTLDPMASGVLPVAIGNAARLFGYFSGKTKVYEAVFRFGADSDTLDTTGELRTGMPVPSESEIAGVLGEFTGKISQIPPKYSAKNINGRRGYELARKGIEFSLPPKEVDVHSISLVGRVSCDSFRFIIECGGGTYIRALARDIAARLGTAAVMSSLVRTRSGIFTIENSVKTAALTAENFRSHIIKTQDVLSFDCIYPSREQAFKLFNGLGVQSDLKDGTYKIFDASGEFYGLAEVNDGVLKVRTKLC